MAAESAISRTVAMLGRRPPAPFTVRGAGLLVDGLGGLVVCRSIATVPREHKARSDML